MTEQERRLEEAFRMLCMWTGFEPSRRNTVVTIALDDILNGRRGEAVNKGWELARAKRTEDARRRQTSTTPVRITLLMR